MVPYKRVELRVFKGVFSSFSMELDYKDLTKQVYDKNSDFFNEKFSVYTSFVRSHKKSQL